MMYTVNDNTDYCLRKGDFCEFFIYGVPEVLDLPKG